MAKGEGYVAVNNGDDVIKLIAIVQNLNNPKSVKAAALARIRGLEFRDRKSYYPAYNGASRNPSEMARVEEEMEG